MGLVALALLVLPVAVAFADYGPHGNFTKTSDGCAACHRAHTAQASYLLVTDENDLCMSCHGTAATGANTNVADGVYVANLTESGNTSIVGNGLKGGGFSHTLMNTSLSTSAVGSTDTVSSHMMDTSASYMWGYGAISATADPGMADVKLECVDCHDPHGMAGAGLTIAGMTTYRILRSYPIVNGEIISMTTSSTIPDEAVKNYTVPNSVSNINPQGTGPIGSSNYTETVPMGYFSRGSSYTQSFYGASTTVTGISKLCGQCHTRHLVGTGNWSTDSGDAIYTYRHTTNTSGNNCTTCHVAHGSSAKVNGFAAEVNWPGGVTATPQATTHEDSALLRIDNRGTCVQCHVPSFQGPVVAGLSATTGASTIDLYGLHFGPSYVSGTSLIYFSWANAPTGQSQTVMVNMASWSGTWSDSTITNVPTAGLTTGRSYNVRVFNGQRANRESAELYTAP